MANDLLSDLSAIQKADAAVAQATQQAAVDTGLAAEGEGNQPPPQQPPVTNTPAAGEHQTAEQQGGDEGATAPADTPTTPPSEDQPPVVDPLLADFGIDLDTPPAGDTPPPVTTPAPVQPTAFQDLGKEFGTEFNSVEDVKKFIDSRVAEVESKFRYPVELDAETRQMADSFVEQDILSEAEIAQGKILNDYHTLPQNDLVYDALIEDMSKKLRRDPTPQEVEERMENMSEEQLEFYATRYADKKNLQAERALERLQGRMEIIKERQRLQAERESFRKEQNRQQLIEAAQNLETIPGTTVSVDDDMRTLAIKAIDNPQLLQQIIFGTSDDAKTRNQFAVANILRMARAQTIAQSVAAKAASDAKREIFEQGQSGGRGASANGEPVSVQEGKSSQESIQSDIGSWMTDTSGLYGFQKR